MGAMPELAGTIGRAPTPYGAKRDDLRRTAPRALVGEWPRRRGLPRDVTAGLVMLAGWIALWTVFVAGVVQPAAAVHAHRDGPAVAAAPPATEVTTPVVLAGASERSGR